MSLKLNLDKKHKEGPPQLLFREKLILDFTVLRLSSIGIIKPFVSKICKKHYAVYLIQMSYYKSSTL